MRRLAIGCAMVWLGCGGAPRAAGETTTDADRRECTAALRFEEPEDAPAATDPEDVPHTQVSLVLICQGEPTRRVSLGTEVGACFREEDDRALLAARCWWAGSGARIVVDRAGESLRARRAGIEEESGIGRYEERARIAIPARAHVQPL